MLLEDKRIVIELVVMLIITNYEGPLALFGVEGKGNLVGTFRPIGMRCRALPSIISKFMCIPRLFAIPRTHKDNSLTILFILMRNDNSKTPCEGPDLSMQDPCSPTGNDLASDRSPLVGITDKLTQTNGNRRKERKGKRKKPYKRQSVKPYSCSSKFITPGQLLMPYFGAHRSFTALIIGVFYSLLGKVFINCPTLKRIVRFD